MQSPGSYIETSASALRTANAKFYLSAIIQCSAQIDHQTSKSHIDTNASTLDKDAGPIANNHTMNPGCLHDD
jgi:hypothetical protein